MKNDDQDHLRFFQGLGAALFFAFLIWAGLFCVLRDIGDGKITAGPLKTERVIANEQMRISGHMVVSHVPGARQIDAKAQ